MKERGLICKDWEVMAILDGRKTVFRRLVRPQPGGPFISYGELQNDPKFGYGFCDGDNYFKCPFGQIGDHLYVRETWAVWKDPNQSCVMYKANNGHKDFDDLVEWVDKVNIKTESKYGKWENPTHMPKKYARIWLKITNIRVERVKDIMDDQARKEGFNGGHDSIPVYNYSATPREHFSSVWDFIYKNWDENPWVWVIEFKRIEV